MSSSEDRLWQNIRNTFRKVASREIPDAMVRVKIDRHSQLVISDEEGYVTVDQHVDIKRSSVQYWKTIFVSAGNSTFPGEIMVPSNKAEVGIISDLDDTILVTDVHSPLRMAINSLFRNPYQRESFKGMQAFFSHLHRGINPLFYLSNSPWNLYRNIIQYLEINRMPKGPLLLRDFGFHFPNPPDSFRHHKELNIKLIMEVYPELSFILIGDAAESDAYIYSSIYNQFPGRINRIFIREVMSKKKMDQLKSDPDLAHDHIHFFTSYTELLSLFQL